MTTFSVIIPTYNGEKFIDNTIESVLNQTYPNFELIIIDDGSSDNTRAILEKHKAKDTRIKVTTTPNSGGPVTPTNIGINLAQGEYIAFLDHDDAWEPKKLEILLTIFKNNSNVGFTLSNLKIFDENTKEISYAIAPTKNNKLSAYHLLSGNYFNTFSVIAVRKSILLRVGSLDSNLSVFADYDLIARMQSYNIEHHFIEEPLVTYRVHQHNTSSLVNSSKKRIVDLERIITKYGKTFEKHTKSLAKIYQAIGRIHLNFGQKDLAISYFKLATKYDPYNPAVYVRLFSAYFGERPYRIFRKIKNVTLRKI